MFRERMDLPRASLVLVSMIWLSALMPKGLEARHSLAVASPEIDEDVVEQLWIFCGLDPITIKEAVKCSDFSSLKNTVGDSAEINQQSRLSMKFDTLETISFLIPSVKDALLECLHKQNSQFRNSGRDENLRYNAKYLKSVLDSDPISRRNLADQPVLILPPASAPIPALAPDQTPAPAPALGSAPSPAPQVVPPSHVPAPSSKPVVASPPASDGYSPVPSPMDKFPGFLASRPNQAPLLPSNPQNNNNRSIVIAVAVTAGMTSLLVASFFYCYHKCCKKKIYSGSWQRDERPLLSLHLSDFSGSSNKSFHLTNSVSTDKLGSLSSKAGSAQNGHVLSFEISSGQNPPSGVASEIYASSTELSNAPSISASLPPAPPLPPPPPQMTPQAKKAADPPPMVVPPPPVPSTKTGSRPPPPPKGSIPLPMGLSSSRPRPSPLGPGCKGDSNDDTYGPKTKLKPFFWDKVLANPDESMVWNQIKSGSFQFNEERIESLFGYSSADKNKNRAKKQLISNDLSSQYIHILDPKKSQNLAISIKALNVKIEEVRDALMEGNELSAELLQTLLRMAPTPDEELKLRLYCGEIAQLGPAEQFLKCVVDIPFAFKRMDVLLFMSSLQEDASEIKESFSSLEVACKELRNSRLFFKLLEAVLKTGNRMNDGTFRGGAQAFKLDTLLKLSDVKGAGGKTTLLHFVVQEIIRSEGMRAARMARDTGSISSLTTNSLDSVHLSNNSPQESGEFYRNLGLKVVSGLSSELENVKKAASLDADALMSTVTNLGHRLVKTREFLNKDMKSLEEESRFHHSLKCFIEHAEEEITVLLEEEKRIRLLVKSTTDYFHGNAGKDEGLRLFVIVRDFLAMLDKACKEVRESANKTLKTPKDRDSSSMTTISTPRQRLFPAIRDRQMDSSSSDDEGT